MYFCSINDCHFIFVYRIQGYGIGVVARSENPAFQIRDHMHGFIRERDGHMLNFMISLICSVQGILGATRD